MSLRVRPGGQAFDITRKPAEPRLLLAEQFALQPRRRRRRAQKCAQQDLRKVGVSNVAHQLAVQRQAGAPGGEHDLAFVAGMNGGDPEMNSSTSR